MLASGGSRISTAIKRRPVPNPEPSFQREEFTPYLLRQVSERLSGGFSRALKPIGKTPNNWRILCALVSGDRFTIGELSESTQAEQSTISRTVSRMEAEGLVRTSIAATDARMIEVTITPVGERAFLEMLPVAEAQYDWAIRNIPERDLAVFKSTLKRMLKNLHFSPIK
jgi:MarR family transcriptional regulator, organic hydroperoxide resistance regulator